MCVCQQEVGGGGAPWAGSGLEKFCIPEVVCRKAGVSFTFWGRKGLGPSWQGISEQGGVREEAVGRVREPCHRIVFQPKGEGSPGEHNLFPEPPLSSNEVRRKVGCCLNEVPGHTRSTINGNEGPSKNRQAGTAWVAGVRVCEFVDVEEGGRHWLRVGSEMNTTAVFAELDEQVEENKGKSSVDAR